MTAGSEPFGVGRRFLYDGLIVTIVEVKYGAAGVEVVVVDSRGQVRRIALQELLDAARARLIPTEDGPARDDEQETAATLLAQATEAERCSVRERAEHVREVLTGYRSGTEEI
jgi:hypothetical protein